MENGLYVAMSRQLTLRRSLDVLANNVANTNTTAFKVETLAVTDRADADARHQVGPEKVTFVTDWALLRDFTQGAFEPTERPLDLALDGPGFLTVLSDDGGLAYTRDGRLAVNAAGELTTAGGARVVDLDDQPIVPQLDERLEINAQGVITAGGQQVAQLKVVEFADRAALTRQGGGLFIPAPDAPPPPPAADTSTLQGMVEKSNVNAIGEITRLIEITRTYESLGRMLSQAEDLRRRSLQRLAQVQ